LAPYGVQTVKIWNFSKTKMAAAAVLKITKMAISQQEIDRSLRNLARLCKMGLLSAQTVEELNFQNPGWRTAAIVKTVKSPYLRNRLTDLDEIWHDDAHWGRPLKFEIFENPRWRNESNNLQPKVKRQYWYVK